ncbi:hypothetical protein [Rhodococcus wratislaviensis]|uniref:hypothetical protein n=1 Tax=Rhodococcus wratislaviensis TaxID=44752 RepID=UPI0035183514
MAARKRISPESTGIAESILSDDDTELAAAVRHDAVGACAPSDLLAALQTTARASPVRSLQETGTPTFE